MSTNSDSANRQRPVQIQIQVHDDHNRLVQQMNTEVAVPLTKPEQPVLLVELYDLRPSACDSTEGEWVQTARWIKYEEDVEGVDQCWGRPHVPCLDYHAVYQLIKFMKAGVALLDVEAYNFGDLAYAMTETLCEQERMTERQAGAFLSTLQRIGRPAKQSKKFSKISLSGSNRMEFDIGNGRGRSVSAVAAHPVSLQVPALRNSVTSIKRKLTQLSHVAFPGRHDVPEMNAEAAQVFAGIIPELREPRFGMVRLRNAILVPECQETVPIRFAFIVVGPPLSDLHYRDLGRAIATMMANPAFREAAYTANDKESLIKELYEFLDCSLVVPPGDIQTKDLFHVDRVRKALKQRKQQKEEAKRLRENARKTSIDSLSDGLITPKFATLAPPGQEEAQEQAKVRDKLEETITQLRPWERTGRPFGGLVRDIKCRLPFYRSDFKDACNVQCISATIFMFFVVFSPAISFGQVMAHRLDGYMGITEVFVAQCACGIVWGLFAGQPLLIQAATGPFLVFESALYEYCKMKNLEFLPVRVWVSLWTFLLSILMALVEASFLIGYVTRFTQDIFTTLIAGIFVFEAGSFVVTNFKTYPVLATTSYCAVDATNVSHFNGTMGDDVWSDAWNATDAASSSEINSPNTALLSFILVIGTFCLAFILKKVRTSHYFGRTVRTALGDFGLPVTILLMVLIYQLAFSDTYLQLAEIPSTFSLTHPEWRGWFVRPMGVGRRVPTWVIPAAIIPAVLVYILLFAEIEIVELLLFSRERGLSKPMGFHCDLVLCGGLMFATSLFGLPWMCGAAVQSLTHATALTIMKKSAPGEKPAVGFVVEQRVTTIVVSILIGACSFLGKILSTIPIAVLLGVFLYLGVSCLINVQFIHRIILLIIPRKYFPDHPYCKQVSMWRMHAFTAVQLLGFAVLWIVNMVTESSLAFPFVIAMDALARRYILPRIFTLKELCALDPSESEKPPENAEDGDIYEEAAMPM